MPEDNMATVIRTMRGQAWERAKGELMAMLATFWGNKGAMEGQFNDLHDAIDEFVAKIEDESLHE